MLKKSETNGTFLNLIQGKLAKRTTQENADLSKGDKHYELFSSLQGVIKNATLVDGYEDGDKEMQLKVEDDGEIYIINVRVGSGYWVSLSRAFPNFDLDKPITIEPTSKKDGEYDVTGMVFKQNGEWVKRYYSIGNENLDNLPPPKEMEINGKTIFDYSEQNNYLAEEIMRLLNQVKVIS